MARSNFLSKSNATFASSLSRITSCSNPAFDKVIKRAWSDPEMQKEVLTVLSALTKIIHERGGKESAVEYYALLLSALNVDSEKKVAEAFLLKLVMTKALPNFVVQKTSGEASKTIINVLKAALSGETFNTSLIKSVTSLLVSCLGYLLLAQDFDSWAVESTRHNYRVLLGLVAHEKPAIRKACHLSIVNILTSSPGIIVGDILGSSHPSCHQTQEYLCSSIQDEAKQLTSLIKTSDANCIRLLYLLDLLASVIHVFPTRNIKAASECILDLTEFPNKMVILKVYTIINNLFDARPLPSRLPVSLAGRLLTALHACKATAPAVLVAQVVGSGADVDTSELSLCTDVRLAWLLALQAGVAHLTRQTVSCLSDSSITTSADRSSPALFVRVSCDHLETLINLVLKEIDSTPMQQLRDKMADLLLVIFSQDLVSKPEC
ncbi:unnamed protein product [Protopolystoma xenopodis]|uniref:RRP12 N-terminal HEAT domain-containing protein n=1 Tax=Protopolystoma xenopodis TaxID=117903 RepID=A0A448WK19_9PLAT|nr:unnamed protein product [Protopolystoma xenopodis]